MSVKFFHTKYATKNEEVRARTKHVALTMIALNILFSNHDVIRGAKEVNGVYKSKSPLDKSDGAKDSWEEKLLNMKKMIRSSKLKANKRGRELFR
jgi:hypothetical protein